MPSYCQNPNSTNNSIELNLRLDYILTASSTPPTTNYLLWLLLTAQLAGTWVYNYTVADQFSHSVLRSTRQMFHGLSYGNWTRRRLWFFPYDMILNFFHVKFIESSHNIQLLSISFQSSAAKTLYRVAELVCDCLVVHPGPMEHLSSRS